MKPEESDGASGDKGNGAKDGDHAGTIVNVNDRAEGNAAVETVADADGTDRNASEVTKDSAVTSDTVVDAARVDRNPPAAALDSSDADADSPLDLYWALLFMMACSVLLGAARFLTLLGYSVSGLQLAAAVAIAVFLGRAVYRHEFGN